MLDHAARTSHYSASEVHTLDFAGPPPDAAALSGRWRTALERATAVVERLPASHAGEAVLTLGGELYQGEPQDVAEALAQRRVQFHAGRIGGALPRIVR